MHTCCHCSLPIGDGVDYGMVVDGTPREFCCGGCQAVWLAIHEAGLQGFYQRVPDGKPLAPPPEPTAEALIYDLDEVQKGLVSCRGAERQVHLLVEGIHCAACVWLIERSLRGVPGVIAANVNLAGKRLHLRWNAEQVKLSELIRRVERIGYGAVPYNAESADGVLRRANRAMLYRLFFAGFAMMNMLWISVALYGGASRDEFRDFFHWMGLALATPTLFYSGLPFFRNAWNGLRSGRLTMDLPIAIGLGLTYLYSAWVTIFAVRVGQVYFDTVTNLTFVILIGRYLEGMFRHQAVSSTQRLLDLQPKVATLQDGSGERIVPVRSLSLGDRVIIKPGQMLAVDGVVVSGASAVDESMLSGESKPVDKGVGDTVSAGTLNTHGMLVVEMRAAVQDTVLAQIIRLVEEAQASKAPVQRLADRVVPWFVLATLSLAAMTFFAWRLESFELALMAATSVMIITCPCALGMATPMSIAVATGLAARRGILIKNGLALETLASVTHVVFDKTGTLTEGRMRVCHVRTTGGTDAAALHALAAAVETGSEHHIARAIVRDLDGVPAAAVRDFFSEPGCGVRGDVGGRSVLVGNAAWLARHGVALDETLSAEVGDYERGGMTCVLVAVDGSHSGLLALADRLRSQAEGLVAELRRNGLRVTMLSGDRRPVAEAVARQLGSIEVIAEVLPQDKDRVIAALQAAGDKVAMVGDGVNDAPALTRADVGIALGSGTDVSVECADVVLMTSELDRVGLAMRLSRRTLRTIKQNIGISFVYNAIMVPLAMAAIVTPLVAAASMPLSSLLVIGNATRIRKVFAGGAADHRGPGEAPAGPARLADHPA